MKKIYILCLVISLSISGFGQEGNWKILLKNGEVVADMVFFSLENDTLALLNSGPLFLVPVQDIAELHVTNSNEKKTKAIVNWIIIGVGAGTVTSLIIYYMNEANKPPPAPVEGYQLIGDFSFGPQFDAMAGALVGGAVGLIVGSYKYNRPMAEKSYIFGNMSDRRKLKVLSRNLKKD